MRDRLTTDKTKIFARESPTLMSITKDELRKLYNEIFDRLQEYEVAEETGKIFVTPCKVGDKVYKVICTNRGNCCGVADFTCEECPYQNREVVEGDVIAIKFVKGVRLKVRFDNFTDYYCEDEIYYAKEEAEQALKGGEG